MIQAFQSGGIIIWPLLLIGIGVLALCGRVALLLLGKGDPVPADVEWRLRAILFWGAMAVALGLLGTIAGIIQMAQAISLASAVEPTLVWGGFGVALVTLIFGLGVFLIASVFWFILRQVFFWGMQRAVP